MAIVTDKYLTEMFKNGTHPLLKTHLSLDRRSIIGLDELRLFCRLQVVDLRDNFIFNVEKLSNQRSLTHLYLQNNEIRSLEGFANLGALEVLYLDGNKVEVFEGLHNCPLKTLSIKAQILPPGVMLAFDPVCMKALEEHLEVVNASRNRLTSISPFVHLRLLEDLDVSNNDLRDLDQFLEDVSTFRCLRKLNLTDTPIANEPSYVKLIVTVCQRLEKLNDRDISLQMRSWCENMSRNRGKPKVSNYLSNRFDDSVSSLPTPLRPNIDSKFVNNVYRKIENK